MNDYNEGYKTSWKLKGMKWKPLFDGVCECQKWVENANQTQLKLIFWYTSWYFSRGVGDKKFLNFTLPPYRILIYTPWILAIPFLRQFNDLYNLLNPVPVLTILQICDWFYIFLKLLGKGCFFEQILSK